MSTRHRLGFADGTIVEHDNGTAAYVAPGAFSEAFRVRIADVTGFSIGKSRKAMKRTLHVMGNGGELARADVNHGASEKIEGWFRAHPHFGGNVQTVRPSGTAGAPPATSLVADELNKLADLRERGVLTDEEFAAQKRRLLS